MLAIIRFFTLIVIVLCVRYLLHISLYSSKVNKTSNEIIVLFPKWLCCIGFGTSLFFTLFIVMAYISNEKDLWVYIVFAVFVILGFFLGIGLINWKIEFIEKTEYFVYTRWYGKKCIIFYKDCEKMQKFFNYIILKANSKTFFIDVYALNADKFEKQLKKKI